MYPCLFNFNSFFLSLSLSFFLSVFFTRSLYFLLMFVFSVFLLRTFFTWIPLRYFIFSSSSSICLFISFLMFDLFSLFYINFSLFVRLSVILFVCLFDLFSLFHINFSLFVRLSVGVWFTFLHQHFSVCAFVCRYLILFFTSTFQIHFLYLEMFFFVHPSLYPKLY